MMATTLTTLKVHRNRVKSVEKHHEKIDNKLTRRRAAGCCHPLIGYNKVTA